MARRADPTRVAEAMLFGALQRLLNLWRAGDEVEVAEQRLVVAELWAGVVERGGDPGRVAASVWSRDVNTDVAAAFKAVDVFGALG